MNNQTNKKQTSEYTYMQTPKFLLTDPKYANLSMGEIALYSFLFDRYRISVQNNKNRNWEDENGVFIYFSRENLALQMRCCKRTIIRYMQKLTLFGLIREKRLGCNKTNKIYVTMPSDYSVMPKEIPSNKTPEKSKASSAAPKKTSSPTSAADFFDNVESPQEVSILSLQEVTKLPANNNDLNKKNKKIDSVFTESIYQSDPIDKNDTIENEKDYNYYKLKVEKQISIDVFSASSDDASIVNSIVHIITQVYMSHTQYMQLTKGELVPTKQVVERLKTLDQFHIEYVLECFKKVSHKIYAVDKYLLKSLYNAPITIEPYYTNQIATNENIVLLSSSERQHMTNFENDISFPGKDVIITADAETEKEKQVEQFKAKLDFDKFVYDWPSSTMIGEEILLIMGDMYCTLARTLKIKGIEQPISCVRENLELLTHKHLVYLKDVLEEANNIQYWDAFVRSKILYANDECDRYYRAKEEERSRKGFGAERRYTERDYIDIHERGFSYMNDASIDDTDNVSA